MYKTVAAILLGFVISLPVMADEWSLFGGENEWSLGGGAAVDVNGDYYSATVAGNWLPKKRSLGTGVITSIQLGRYDYDEGSGNRVAVAVVPVLTYRGFYAGMGVSLGNTTPNLGTAWNFASAGGYQHNFDNGMFARVEVTHESHGARMGIEEDKANGGVTQFGGQVGWRF